MIQGYYLESSHAAMDISQIHAFLSKAYWCEGIPFETLEKGIRNSVVAGVFSDAGEQVGFARAITDRATFAYLADVYVLVEHRGKGLSKWMVGSLLAMDDLKGLRRFTLATKDAFDLYSRFGFTSLNQPEIFMEKWDSSVYK